MLCGFDGLQYVFVKGSERKLDTGKLIVIQVYFEESMDVLASDKITSNESSQWLMLRLNHWPFNVCKWKAATGKFPRCNHMGPF